MTWTPLGPFFNQGGMAGGNQVWAAFGAPSGADERLAACGVAGRTVAGGRMPHSHAEPGRVWQAGRARPPGTAHGWGLNARRPCCCPQIPPIPFRRFLRGSPRSGSVSPRGGREGLIPQVCCSREPPLAAPPHTPGCRLLSCHSCGCSGLLPSHLRGREEPGPPGAQPRARV